MNRFELSELNFGLILAERRPATLYRPEWFSSPFDAGVEILQKKGASKEDVAKTLSSSYMNDAHDSVKRLNGLGEEVDWVKSLQSAFYNEERGKKLEKLGKKLKENESVDLLPLYAEIGSAISDESSGLAVASDIDYNTYKPFKLSGYDPLDLTVGGIPSDGPIIIYGLTGVGKSKFVTCLINALLHKYPEDTAAIYTLEMGKEHWLWRTMDLFPSMKEVLNRLYVSGTVKDIEELVAEITAKKVNYVVLDDMDNLVKSSDASEYERVYRRVKEVCRFMNIPFFVLCQPNRQAKFAVENGERFLGRFDVAWSGAAENSAALQIALQVANGVDMQSEMFPTLDENLDYIILWKSRDGWLGDRDNKYQRGPGAIVLQHTSNWTGKFYTNKAKLWTPTSGSRKMTKSKKREED